VLAYAHNLAHEICMALARTNLTLPEELMRAVDDLAGPRGRSRYVAEAVAQRVKRDRLGRAIRESAGVLQGTALEMSREQVAAWVDELRSEETD
jgi:metal-responsive CopG/Arc/MetJ family transcriptional regulator